MNDRAKQVLEAAEETVNQGETPTAEKLAERTGFRTSDTHLCLNILEKEDKVKTRNIKSLTKIRRIVEVKRQ